MSTVLHPVGPQRARVYWVRRLLVVLVVVALVVLVTTAVSWLRGDRDGAAAAAATGTSAAATPDGAASAGDDTAGDEARGGASADDAESAAAAAGDEDDAETEDDAAATPVDCTPESLQLTLTSPEVEFDAGTTPVLTATVTNVGDVPCTVDAGAAAREVVISSGEDRVWSTKDCATEESASRQLLLGEGAADAVEIEWARVRSADGCPSGLPEPKAGTYQAVATLGKLSSQTVVFILE
jgi:hypothetical protein